MTHKSLYQPMPPTYPLTVEHFQCGRNFRPTTVSRNLYDTVFSSEIAAITDHTYQHVHVFGKRVSTISPRSHHHILVEHTVTSRNVRHGIDSRPPHLSDKKRTHVFQGLKQRTRSMRWSEFHHLPLFYPTAVRSCHDSTDGYHVLRFQKRHDTTRNSVFGKNAIHIGIDEIRVGGSIKPGIDGIGFRSSVFLIHHNQPFIFGPG